MVLLRDGIMISEIGGRLLSRDGCGGGGGWDPVFVWVLLILCHLSIGVSMRVTFGVHFFLRARRRFGLLPNFDSTNLLHLARSCAISSMSSKDLDRGASIKRSPLPSVSYCTLSATLTRRSSPSDFCILRMCPSQDSRRRLTSSHSEYVHVAFLDSSIFVLPVNRCRHPAFAPFNHLRFFSLRLQASLP